MSERKVLSAVFPAHADLQPILKEIREKYNLPKLGLMDKDISELLLSDKDIPWDEIRQEIRTRIETLPEFLPEAIQNLRQLIQNSQSVLENPDTLIEAA